jgi:hypothetical protein
VGETGLEELGRLGLTESGPARWRVVGWRGTTWRGWSSVVEGRLFSQEAIRCLCGAQDGVDEAGGGPVWAHVVEVLSGGRCSLVGGERREGRRPVGSEWWPAWRADPQSMMTWRYTRWQQ